MAKFIKNNFNKFLLSLGLVMLLVGSFFFFNHFSAKAQEQIKIMPESFSGDWQNPEAVFSQDLGDSATLEDFNTANSAYPLEILREELLQEEVEPAPESLTEETATTTEEIATSTEETITVPEENTTSTNTTTTVETKNPSFFTRLWQKIRNLFNSEARAESSVCQSGSNRPCGSEVGICQIGVQICQQGVWGECIGAVLPSQEICDGVDNDCNGMIDEGGICGLGQACQYGSNRPCSTEVGACEIGVQICNYGVWGECFGGIGPSREICDGVDNDCDGQIDEGGICGRTSSVASQVERVLTFSNFNVSLPLDTKIKFVHLRLSLAAKGEVGDKLIVDYFYQDIWQNLEIFNLENEISNDLNGGYFLYGLPIFQNEEELKNLKIRFIYLSEVEQTSLAQIFLDGIWLEMETEEVEETEKYSLKSIKKDWRRDENPEFEIEEAPQGLFTKITSAFEQKEIEVTLIDPEGEENLEEVIIQDNKIKIAQTNLRGFRPGLYKLKVTIKENGKEFIQTQEFSWGVLAINFNKSIYLPNERAYLQMGVLDDKGHTICDAHLEIQVTNPYLQTTILSTADGTIQYSGKCGPDNVTDVPDYFAYYQVDRTGFYQVKLIATTINGVREITDQFGVRESVPFEVERIGPTRIYPLEPYPITFSIISNQDFEGVIEERIPASFEIFQPVYSKKYSSISQEGNTKLIKWEVSLTTGEQVQLGYRFDAPDISPYLYLLGPLKIGSFQETRHWQIASDAPDVTILTDGTSWNIPEDWNSANNTIEVIGGGGGGANGSGTKGDAGGGGAGGTYAIISNLSLSYPGSVTYGIGAAGEIGLAGGDTWFNADNAAACVDPADCVKGRGGGGGSNPTGGSAQADSVGDTTYDGGAGGSGGTGGVGLGGDGGGGGGGAGGLNEAGIAGTSSVGGTGAGGDGGAGDNGSGGTGGTGGAIDNSGGAGNAGIEWEGTHGSGGGGGGGGGGSGKLGIGGTGGASGAYGAGSGGGGSSGKDQGTGGSGNTGNHGIIVITYEPYVPNDPPTISSLVFHNNLPITIPEWATGEGNNFYQATTTFSVQDDDGWETISTTTIFVYRSGVMDSGNCSTSDDANINNCYPSTSTSAWNPTDGAGDVCDMTHNNGVDIAYFWCTTTLYYCADPTDASSVLYSGENWTVYVSTTDLTGAQHHSANNTVEVTTNKALEISPDTIDYSALAGNLIDGSNTGKNWATTTVTTTGNIVIDIHFSGGDLTADGQTRIPAYWQKFTTTTGLSYTDATPIQLPTSSDWGAEYGGRSHDLDMIKPTTASPGAASADNILWGIGIPSGQAAATYGSTTDLTATSTVDT